MKFLFNAADKYLKQSDWKDLALIKFCLFSIGLLCGASIKGKHKKHFSIGALVVFIATYVTLMADFLPMLKSEIQQEELNRMINIETE
ncbi:MAG: permease of phosphate ABC transporter [Oscillospiraceae bacterium]|nr:permease of phosphate ABC transporter [Oscillospiraceae bacterium]